MDIKDEIYVKEIRFPLKSSLLNHPEYGPAIKKVDSAVTGMINFSVLVYDRHFFSNLVFIRHILFGSVFGRQRSSIPSKCIVRDINCENLSPTK